MFSQIKVIQQSNRISLKSKYLQNLERVMLCLCRSIRIQVCFSSSPKYYHRTWYVRITNQTLWIIFSLRRNYTIIGKCFRNVKSTCRYIHRIGCIICTLQTKKSNGTLQIIFLQNECTQSIKNMRKNVFMEWSCIYAYTLWLTW